jgi:Flp pilus assembly protein TadD
LTFTFGIHHSAFYVQVEMRLKIFICLLLAGITLAIYWPVRHYGIIYYDDPLFVTANAMVNSGLNWHSLGWAFSGAMVANWHPVTSLSFVLGHQFWGANPGAEHLVNVLFHTANAVLLFLVLNRMMSLHSDNGAGASASPAGATWRSAVAAALFAWHPLRVESVAWISERKDVLCGFFFLLTLWAYARYARESRVQSPKSKVNNQAGMFHLPSSRFYWLALVFFALGLMSKPMLVSVPFLLLLLDIWPLKRIPNGKFRMAGLKPLACEKWPFFALAAMVCVTTYEIQKKAAQMASFELLGLTERIGHAVMGYVNYLGKLFWPAKLSVIYPYAKIGDATEVWLAAALLLAISILCLLQFSRRPCLAIGWFWFLIASLPIIGLVQVGGAAMADRYTYLPLIGPVMSLVWLVSEWAEKVLARKVFAAAATIFLLGVLATGSRRQVELWKSTVSLFQHAIAVTPGDNSAAQCYLGAGFVHENLAQAAMVQFRIAAKMNPLDPLSRDFLAILLCDQGRWAAAAEQYSAILDISPNDLPARLNLAHAWSQMGRAAEAVSQLEAALQINPGSAEVMNNLAWELATSEDNHVRNGARAVELAERACELTHYKRTIYIGTLAAACAEAGRFDDAMAAAQKAIALAQQNGEQNLLQKNRELLERYRQHRTARQ